MPKIVQKLIEPDNTPGERGIFTSEFLTWFLVNLSVFAGALAGDLPSTWAAVASAISTGLYAVARGYSKNKDGGNSGT